MFLVYLFKTTVAQTTNGKEFADAESSEILVNRKYCSNNSGSNDKMILAAMHSALDLTKSYMPLVWRRCSVKG